jgi:hypothetical protein
MVQQAVKHGTDGGRVAQPPEQLLAGEDPQMQKALELAREPLIPRND